MRFAVILLGFRYGLRSLKSTRLRCSTKPSGLSLRTENPSQNRCQNLPKVDAKTYPNRCQNLPKSCPRRSKIEVWRGTAKSPFWSLTFSAPGGRLGASWGRPGSVLGASWGRLGSLRASWELLGAVLRRLGDVLGCISLPIQLESDF